VLLVSAAGLTVFDLYSRVANATALANDTRTTPHPVCATRLFVIPLAMSHVKKRNELKPWKVKVQAIANLVGILMKAGRLPKDVASDTMDTSMPRKGEDR
jgi:hypothetical protein